MNTATRIKPTRSKTRLTERHAKAKASQVKLKVLNVVSKRLLQLNLDIPALALRTGISQKRIGELLEPLNYKLDLVALLVVCADLNIRVKINGKAV